MAASPGNLGVLLWEQGALGSDHTSQPGQPVQTLVNPETSIYADAGVTAVDMFGQLYIKTTDRTLATGWCMVPCIGQQLN